MVQKKTAKEFRKVLVNQSNSQLLDTIKYKSYYSKADVNAVQAEINRRKKSGKLRQDAGVRRTRQKASNNMFGSFGFFR